MQFIIKELNSINYSLTHPTVWEIASVIISALGLLATVVVIIYNHKSIVMAQKSISQAINLQLYEKRLELYKQLQDQNAFEKVPVEIKIVYSEQIYILYSQISELCYARGNRLAELAIVDKYINWRLVRYYNVCEEVIQSVDKVLIRYRESEDADKNIILALQELRDEVFNYTEQIKEKRALLQENMEKKLKCSIGNEE